MGAAAVLMASGHTLPAEVKGLIADCGFQSMEGQMRDMAANWFHLHHIPLLLIELKTAVRNQAFYLRRERMS